MKNKNICPIPDCVGGLWRHQRPLFIGVPGKQCLGAEPGFSRQGDESFQRVCGRVLWVCRGGRLSSTCTNSFSHGDMSRVGSVVGSEDLSLGEDVS